MIYLFDGIRGKGGNSGIYGKYIIKKEPRWISPWGPSLSRLQFSTKVGRYQIPLREGGLLP